MMGMLEPHSAGSHPDPRHHGRSDHESGQAAPALEAVLETECIALLALEATRVRMRILPGDHDRAEQDIGGAIDLLRHAIDELRARVGGESPSLLALGFVATHEEVGGSHIPSAAT